MKAIFKFSVFALLFSASCHPKNTAYVGTGNAQGPVAFCGPLSDSCIAKGRLAGFLSFPESNANRASLLLRLTVSNTGGNAGRFCKWQTPFETQSGRFLEIRNERGEEVPYLGISVNKVVPPSEDAYISVAPQTGISADIDLFKVYKFSSPGTYTIKYTGELVSNVCVQDSIRFIYK
ncbi:hypothetical protein D0C36_19820 [Mucilaginibacter conchicola]|uniref:Protease n=1 Tax=Mucilaginibacter conchicola TaxID=2303333 RepID=A0A372NQI5_9SPHI|nr:hypothetical protein [Mucilaginibacter conchicola]RFZ91189.1 hypothetical protein D0C36_19820 [Mucilaginibacter conchicola]